MTSYDSPLSFLDLPAELRNRVYKLALAIEPGDITLKISFHEKRFVLCEHTTKRNAVFKPILPPTPNILSTCKQVLHEALPVLYGNVVIRANSTFVFSLSRVLERMGLTLFCIRHLHLWESLSLREIQSEPALFGHRHWIDLPDVQSLRYEPTVDSAETLTKCDEHIASRILALVTRMKENRSKTGKLSNLCDMLKVTVYCGRLYFREAKEVEIRVLALLEEKLKD